MTSNEGVKKYNGAKTVFSTNGAREKKSCKKVSPDKTLHSPKKFKIGQRPNCVKY